MSEDLLQRRRRIAIVAHVLAFPGLSDAEYDAVRTATFASDDRRPALLDDLAVRARQRSDAAVRIRRDLPALFAETFTSEMRRGQFDEVYKALLREAEACGLGLWSRGIA